MKFIIKKAAAQAAAIKPLYNDFTDKIHYTINLGKSLYDLGGYFVYVREKL